MSSRRFLLISYYWPPAGGGGVQRWLKMSKYLPDEGWAPVVYTAEPEIYPAKDESLLAEVRPEIEVHKRPIWEPHHVYDKLMGRKKGSSVYSGFIQEGDRSSLKRRLSLWIRANVFIPDARAFWIRPSIRHLKRILNDLEVDAIVSTGPPHSMHLIAQEIARTSGLPWVADFRDPWTQIDFFEHLPLTPPARWRHRSLEQKVLRDATAVVTVSDSWVQAFRDLSDRDDIVLIRNGFDPQDFQGVRPGLEADFTMVHLGSLNADRNPQALWESLAALKGSEQFAGKMKVVLTGPVDGSIKASVTRYDLDDLVVYQNFLPHDEAIRHIRRAHVLILPINETSNNQGVIPGKLYEYFATGRPVLCIGPPDSDAVQLVDAVEGCASFDYSDTGAMTAQIHKWYGDYLAGRSFTIQADLEAFSRKYLAGMYAQLLSGITRD